MRKNIKIGICMSLAIAAHFNAWGEPATLIADCDGRRISYGAINVVRNRDQVPDTAILLTGLDGFVFGNSQCQQTKNDDRKKMVAPCAYILDGEFTDAQYQDASGVFSITENGVCNVFLPNWNG